MTNQHHEFDQLSIVEIYEYYDQPLLYSARSISGKLYLVVLSSGDRKTETWLHVRVSDQRLALIRSGEIDLHDAFTDAEDGLAFSVTHDRATGAVIDCQTVYVNDLGVKQLPIAGERLDMKDPLPAWLQPNQVKVDADVDRWLIVFVSGRFQFGITVDPDTKPGANAKIAPVQNRFVQLPDSWLGRLQLA